ncbi:MAG: citrate lyase acyl carrier protein [Acidaminobacteraceae bacterium]
MKIMNTVSSGTTESSDIRITIAPNILEEIKVNLSSVVIEQFGDQIKDLIISSVKELGITSAVITAKDRGALDCTIKARVQTAVVRSIGNDELLDWRTNDEA